MEWLFDLSAITQRGVDAATYLVLALVGTSLFLLRLLLTLLGNDADTGDLDTGGDLASDASFTVFSLLSLLAFIMGTGWMGLAARVDWELGRVVSALLAVGFGTTMMMLASALMYGARRLNREVSYDVRTAIGTTARVYLTIPARGEGEGQIEVSVSGRRKVLTAVSIADKIDTFTAVRVVDARDDGVLIVERWS